MIYQNYLLNNTHYLPEINYTGNTIGEQNANLYVSNPAPQFGAQYSSDLYTPDYSSQNDPYAADDGKISTADKVKSFLKGVVSPVTSMFSSPKNFAIGALSMAAGAALIVATGGAAAPLFVAAGLVGGTIQFAKSAYGAAVATTDDEARAAWQGMGSGAGAVAGSVAGSKAALNAAGVNTAKTGIFGSVIECFKAIPSCLSKSFNSFSSGAALVNLKSALGIKLQATDNNAKVNSNPDTLDVKNVNTDKPVDTPDTPDVNIQNKGATSLGSDDISSSAANTVNADSVKLEQSQNVQTSDIAQLNQTGTTNPIQNAEIGSKQCYVKVNGQNIPTHVQQNANGIYTLVDDSGNTYAVMTTHSKGGGSMVFDKIDGYTDSSDGFNIIKSTLDIESLNSSTPKGSTGAGTQMIREAVRMSNEMGYDGRVTLQAEIINKSVGTPVPFYSKLGFKATSAETQALIEQAMAIYEQTGVYNGPTGASMYLPMDVVKNILGQA